MEHQLHSASEWSGALVLRRCVEQPSDQCLSSTGLVFLAPTTASSCCESNVPRVTRSPIAAEQDTKTRDLLRYLLPALASQEDDSDWQVGHMAVVMSGTHNELTIYLF